jgi:hypothetical protein
LVPRIRQAHVHFDSVPGPSKTALEKDKQTQDNILLQPKKQWTRASRSLTMPLGRRAYQTEHGPEQVGLIPEMVTHCPFGVQVAFLPGTGRRPGQSMNDLSIEPGIIPLLYFLRECGGIARPGTLRPCAGGCRGFLLPGEPACRGRLDTQSLFQTIGMRHGELFKGDNADERRLRGASTTSTSFSLHQPIFPKDAASQHNTKRPSCILVSSPARVFIHSNHTSRPR